MANNIKLFRSGYKSALSLFFRPQSSFMGRSSTLVKKNTASHTAPAQATNVISSQSPLVTIQRLASSLFQRQTGAFLNQSIVRSSSSASHEASAHSSHWNVERYLSVALLAIIPAGLALENSVADYLLAVSLVLHSHWGLQNILTDYVHGPTLPRLATALLYIVSGLSLIGLCYFNYNDIGISKAVKKIWSL